VAVSPRALCSVRNALVYVLQNFKKHLPAARGIDPYWSGRWFAGCRTRRQATPLRLLRSHGRRRGSHTSDAGRVG
jgi:hypothetical protein